jgi:hypothetical protein
MKILRLFVILSIIALSSSLSFAQVIKETFSVPGNCGMCKQKIESAAKSAGATYASWNEEAKILTLQQKRGTAGRTKIQLAIAAAGYDTPAMKASTEAYSRLQGCCKYERVAEKGDTAITPSSTNQTGDHQACANCSMQKECCKDQKCGHTAAKSAGGITPKEDCCNKS